MRLARAETGRDPGRVPVEASREIPRADDGAERGRGVKRTAASSTEGCDDPISGATSTPNPKGKNVEEPGKGVVGIPRALQSPLQEVTDDGDAEPERPGDFRRERRLARSRLSFLSKSNSSC
mmetsp:Transcript_86170/g.136022  ORF Transcript_86170/g.136022 Transcript_86170/m.136022 type:complete len:122 (-) Transcript_86170:516-881(-)